MSRFASLSVPVGILRFKGSARQEFLADVWKMYEVSYGAIGMHIPSPQTMLSKYPVWELHVGPDEKAKSFVVYDDTPFGLKVGVGGSDGSPEGKNASKERIRTGYNTEGIFSEVSHLVEKIALAAGVPVVCPAYVSEVIGKHVTEDEDGLHYYRDLTGVGKVRKIMVGHPRGVPTTSYNSPSCPPVESTGRVASWGPDTFDLADHLASVVDLDD